MCILHRNYNNLLLNQNRRARWDNMAIIKMRKSRRTILLIASACILAGMFTACSKEVRCTCSQDGDIFSNINPEDYGVTTCSALAIQASNGAGTYVSCWESN